MPELTTTPTHEQNLNSTYYSPGGFPLTTMSDWGWHSQPPPLSSGANPFQTYTYDYLKTSEGRAVPYPLSTGTPAAQWLRANPHRLDLMQMALRHRTDTFKPLRRDTDVLRVGASQSLDPWSGELVSNFTLASAGRGGNRTRVSTRTVCHMDLDVLSWRVESDALFSGPDNMSGVVLRMAFPYGSEAEYGGGADWGQDDKHATTVVRTTKDSALLRRRLDWDEYEVLCRWGGAGVQGAKRVRDG